MTLTRFGSMVLSGMGALLVVLSAPAAPAGSEGRQIDEDTLRQCRFDGLVNRLVDRKRPGLTRREVDTAAGKKRVSVEEGYRLVLEYPRGGTFGNIKVEWSPERTYTRDRQTILEQMERLASMSPGGLAQRRVGPFEAWLIHDSLRLAPQGMYVFFDESRRMVVTSYLFAEPAKVRGEGTPEEYQAMRERFLEQLAECVAPPPSGIEATLPPQ